MKSRYFTLITLILSIIMLITLFGNLAYNTRHSSTIVKNIHVPETTTEVTKIELSHVEDKYVPVLYTYYEMELTSLGTYYLTAYCPHECGYKEYSDGSNNYPVGWRTASGEICHRADWAYRLSEPTTCAISRSVHNFGDEFYIPEFDRTFIAEDTGPGVQGRHLDLFYESYDEMASFPTGYYEVYAVTWVEKTIVVSEEELKLLEEYGATEFFLEKERNESN